MHQIRIDMQGKFDKDGNRYYVISDPIPAHIDLNQAVILVFPWSEPDPDRFGAEMVIKHRSLGRHKP